MSVLAMAGQLEPVPAAISFDVSYTSAPQPLSIENLGLGADLELDGLELNARIEGQVGVVSFVGTISNAGDVDAGNSQVSIYLIQEGQGTANDLLLNSFQIESIASGNLIDFEAIVTLPTPLETGIDYFISVIIDSSDDVFESNEDNNVSPLQTIRFADEADLEATINIEPYILLVRDGLDISTTSDLSAFGANWRLGEALSNDDLDALHVDLNAAGVSNFQGTSLFQFQALPALQNGTVDALLMYRDSALLDPVPDGVVAFEIPNVSGPLRNYDPEINMIVGTSSDNLLIATQASDLIIGGEGRDTAVFAGAQSNYTLTLTSSSVTLRDRGDTTGIVDSLISIETLDFETEVPVFGGRPMRLDVFSGPAQLTVIEFGQITELYIAYFNRAPDAIGLYYWATEFEDGFTLKQMASSFFKQAETRETYASVLDQNGNLMNSDAFVTAVYGNVLGRLPDASGFAYWTNELENNPKITPPIFIRAIINGAKFPGNPTTQTQIDQAYLATKSEIGAYYSVIKGLSDVGDARSVMAVYDGSPASVHAAVTLTNDSFEMASSTSTGDFLFPLVGVIDDPFAMN